MSEKTSNHVVCRYKKNCINTLKKVFFRQFINSKKMYPRVGAAPKVDRSGTLVSRWRGKNNVGCPLPSTRLGNVAWHSSCSSANSWETAYGILYFLTDTFWVSAGCVKIYWLVCGNDTLVQFLLLYCFRPSRLLTGSYRRPCEPRAGGPPATAQPIRKGRFIFRFL